MSFHIVEIKRPSSNAISKMRRGENVRISAGSGFPIAVHNDRLNDIGRKFAKGAKHTLALTKEELNKNYEHLVGKGIFGKKFDDSLKKAGVKKMAYRIGDLVKPAVIGGIDTLAGMASLAQPELAPLALGGAYLATDYINNPKAYQDAPKQKASDQLNKQMNDQFNTNYGADLQNTLNQLNASSQLAQIKADNNIAAATNYISPLITSGVNAPQTLNQVLTVPTVLPTQDIVSSTGRRSMTRGNGLYVNMGSKGDGLWAGMAPSAGGDLTSSLIHSNVTQSRGHGLHAKRHGKIYEKGSVMAGGNLLYNSQATSSQPYLAYNMQSNFVQPAVRKFRDTVTNWS